LISALNPQYFWDVDLSGLNDEQSCRLIIERVFSLGEPEEMNRVIRFYGRDRVVGILTSLPYIDAKTLNFTSKLVNKPIEEFRCHQLQQSRPRYWNL